MSKNNPGPGEYKPENAYEALDKKQVESNIKKCSSMFLSKSNRVPQTEKKGEVKPAVGQYS